jgi:hypothetical protein
VANSWRGPPAGSVGVHADVLLAVWSERRPEADAAGRRPAPRQHRTETLPKARQSYRRPSRRLRAGIPAPSRSGARSCPPSSQRRPAFAQRRGRRRHSPRQRISPGARPGQKHKKVTEQTQSQKWDESSGINWGQEVREKIGDWHKRTAISLVEATDATRRGCLSPDFFTASRARMQT